jgi:hypothetical protein
MKTAWSDPSVVSEAFVRALDLTRSRGERSFRGKKWEVVCRHSGRIMIAVNASNIMGRSTPGTVAIPIPPIISRIPNHHLFRIAALRSTSSGVRFLVEEWSIVLWRKGSRMVWTWTMRCGVDLEVKPLCSTSRFLKDDHKGSLS